MVLKLRPKFLYEDTHLPVHVSAAINVEIHKKYNIYCVFIFSLNNDVALAELSHTIVYTPYIQPVCLPQPHYDSPLPFVDIASQSEYSDCHMVGWGKTTQSSKSSSRDTEEGHILITSMTNTQWRAQEFSRGWGGGGGANFLALRLIKICFFILKIWVLCPKFFSEDFFVARSQQIVALNITGNK